MLRVRAWGRTQWRAAAVVAVLVGVVAGAVLALAAGTRRTASAPDRYTEASGGDPDLGLFQAFGPPLSSSIRALPGVTEVSSQTFVTAFPVGPAGVLSDVNPFAGDDTALGGRVVEGRFNDPAQPDEFTANRAAADLMGARVGQRFDVESYSQEQAQQNQFQPGVELAGPQFEATLVGIVQYPVDLEDSAPAIVFSAALLDAEPDIGQVATLMTVRSGQPADAPSILTAIRALPGGDGVFQDEVRIVGPSARRAVRLQVTALWIVTSVAAVVAALIVAQLVARLVRATGTDRDPLRALGYSRQQAAVEATVQAAAVGAVAALVAIAVAVTSSGAFPIGVLRSIEPAAGPAVDVVTVLVGAAVVVVLVVAVAAATAYRTTAPSAEAAPAPARLPDLVASAGAGPALVTGLRFALSGHGSGRARTTAVAMTAVIGVAGLIGSLLAGFSLIRMIDDRAIWGADYDELIGNPFLPAVDDIVTPAADDPDVAELTAATSGTLSIDGMDVPVLAFEPVRGGILPVILAGRVPSAPNEIAIGRLALRALERSVGDTVLAQGPAGDGVELDIVGVTVVPGDGGDGAAMTLAAYTELAPDAGPNLLLVRFRPGASPDEATARISSITATPPGTTDAPTTVLAFERVVPAPFALAAVVAVMAIAALAYHLSTSVRGRSRDLAILRALGADRRLLRAAVHWQGTYVAALGLLVGVPVGVAVGRRVHRSVADSVGVVPAVDLPITAVVATVIAAVLVANAAAIAPARRAVRAPAADLLREG